MLRYRYFRVTILILIFNIVSILRQEHVLVALSLYLPIYNYKVTIRFSEPVLLTPPS